MYAGEVCMRLLKDEDGKGDVDSKMCVNSCSPGVRIARVYFESKGVDLKSSLTCS